MVDMTVFHRLKKLCEEQKISINELEVKLKLGTNTLYSWKKQKPNSVNLEKIADYFDVSVDYLLGRTDKKRYYDLTEKDERDIQKELEEMINSLSNNGYAAFDGSTIDDLEGEDRDLLIASLKNTLEMSRRLAKKKFTPKKYR